MALMVIAAAACSTEPTQPGADSSASEQVEVGQSVRLRPGQIAQVRGTAVQIAFRRVAEDSRCPINAICVWSGDALVRVDVTEGRRAWTEVTLHTDLEPRSVEIGDYRVRITDLQPLPMAGDTVPQSQYTAAFEVTRK